MEDIYTGEYAKNLERDFYPDAEHTITDEMGMDMNTWFEK